MSGGGEPFGREGEIVFVEFDSDGASIVFGGGCEGRATAHKRIEDKVAGIGRREDDALQEGEGFLRRVFALGFLIASRCG
jgi:hypothetical protein